MISRSGLEEGGRRFCVVLCGVGTWLLHYSNYPTVTPVSGINGSLVHSSPQRALRIVRLDYYGRSDVCADLSVRVALVRFCMFGVFVCAKILLESFSFTCFHVFVAMLQIFQID